MGQFGHPLCPRIIQYGGGTVSPDPQINILYLVQYQVSPLTATKELYHQSDAIKSINHNLSTEVINTKYSLTNT
jgi:hypothetical protein